MTVVRQNLSPRRAALAVHAMTPADREWVLRELPSPQRDVLQPLLLELDELGIPKDAELLRDATALLSPGPVGPGNVQQEAVLSAGSARSLVRWLRSEPPQAGARLLNACPAWRAGLLRVLPRPQQRSMASLAASLPPAPELERMVLAAARRHLLSVPAASPISWLRRLALPMADGEHR